MGHLVEQRSKVGKYSSMLYIMRRRKGDRWPVWGNKTLDEDTREPKRERR